MADDTKLALVDDLLDAMVADPTRLPLTEIARLNRSGLDAAVRRSGERTVAVVSARPAHGVEGLTPRQNEVGRLVAQGRTNRQIAAGLGISLATVKDHVHAILAKSGSQSRSDFAAKWYQGRS